MVEELAFPTNGHELKITNYTNEVYKVEHIAVEKV